jgi:hypothetical protein
MQHQRGDVPGPTTKGGERTEDSARSGEHAASGQTSPPAPLGYGEEASENTGRSGKAPDPAPEKYYDPSEGESAARAGTPRSGGGCVILPGEDS